MDHAFAASAFAEEAQFVIPEVPPDDEPPVISTVGDQSTYEDTPTRSLEFVIGDRESPAGELHLSASSSNPILVPVGSVALAGEGTRRTLRITPATDQSGEAQITVTVTDLAGQTASTSFHSCPLPERSARDRHVPEPLQFRGGGAASGAHRRERRGHARRPTHGARVSSRRFGPRGRDHSPRRSQWPTAPNHASRQPHGQCVVIGLRRRWSGHRQPELTLTISRSSSATEQSTHPGWRCHRGDW